MVVPRMSERMIEALKIENKYVEAHFYEGEAHGFDEPANKKDAWERIVRFVNRYCKETGTQVDRYVLTNRLID
jgi:dipeptidyl aminopeptidase/acylaminoacyl peptidase